MKRIVKSAETMFQEVKDRVEDGFVVNSGMVEYKDGNTILYVDADQKVETYNILPEDEDFKELAEEFIRLHSMSLDDFVNFYSDPNDVSDMEVHDAWFDFLRDCRTADEVEDIYAEWEEFDEKKALSDFIESIRGKDLEWIRINYNVEYDDEHYETVFYKVSNKGEEYPLKFEIRHETSDNSISVSNAVAIVDEDGDVEDYEVGENVETTFYGTRERNYVDDSVLQLTEEQELSLELLKLAFRSAKESGLRIFDTPELGTYAFNGKKLKFDEVMNAYNEGESAETNFLFKKDSTLKTDIPGLTDEIVFWRWYGGEEAEYGLSVAES